MFRHNNFACGLCLSIVALTATMWLYNVKGGDELIKRKKAKKHQYLTFPDQYLPTPLERSETPTMMQQNFHFSTQAQYPSLGFVTAQEIHNTTNNKKQRRNLDSDAFRPRVIKRLVTNESQFPFVSDHYFVTNRI